MSLELLSDGRVVDAGYCLKDRDNRSGYNACDLCIHNRFTCQNYYNREIRLPLSFNYDYSRQIMRIELKDRQIILIPTNEVLADGVEEGFYKCEEDVPKTDKCGWFEPIKAPMKKFRDDDNSEMWPGIEYYIKNETNEKEGEFYFDDGYLDEE